MSFWAGIQSRVLLFVLSLLLTFGISRESKAQDQDVRLAELARLYRERDRLQEIIELVEDGKDSCFESSCQDEKRQLLYRIQTQFFRLPQLEVVEAKDRASALLSARRLVHHQYNDLKDSPRNLSDWLRYYQKRVSHDLEFQAAWVFYRETLTFTRNSIRYFLKKSNSNLFQERFEQQWQKGAATAANLIQSSRLLSREKDALVENSNAYLRIQRALDKNFREVEKIQSQLSQPLGQFLLESFPEINREDHLRLMHFLYTSCEYYECRSPFDSDYQEFLNEFQSESKKIIDWVLRFDQLEYGVVGLNNLDSPANPVRKLQNEVSGQEKIDQFENWSRTGLDIGIFFLQFSAAQSLFSNSRYLPFLAVGHIQYFEFKFDSVLSDELIPRSTRSEKLRALESRLKGQIEARIEALQNFQLDARQKLQELNQQIQTLEELS